MKSPILGFCTTEEIREKLDSGAGKLKVSRSVYIGLIIKNYFDNKSRLELRDA